MLLVDQRPVADGLELAERGRQAGRDDPLDQLVVSPAVGDQILDRDHLQAVALDVGDQVGHTRHRPVVVHHLADHASRVQPGEPREIDAGLGVAGPLEHAARLGLQGVDMPGLAEVRRSRSRVDRDLDRVGPVVGRDPGRDTLAGLDRDRERCLEGRLVLRGHQVQAELVAPVGGQRQADPAARLLGHEVDRRRCRELGGHHEVPLVLPVLVVADDDHPALADLLDRLVDRRERARRLGAHAATSLSTSIRLMRRPASRHRSDSYGDQPPRRRSDSCGDQPLDVDPTHAATSFSTCLASTSTSTLIRLPTRAAPNVVRLRVSGIRATLSEWSSTAATVRLTPSSATDPFSTT